MRLVQDNHIIKLNYGNQKQKSYKAVMKKNDETNYNVAISSHTATKNGLFHPKRNEKLNETKNETKRETKN